MTQHSIVYFVWSLFVYILRDVCPHIFMVDPPFLVHHYRPFRTLASWLSWILYSFDPLQGVLC